MHRVRVLAASHVTQQGCLLVVRVGRFVAYQKSASEASIIFANGHSAHGAPLKYPATRAVWPLQLLLAAAAASVASSACGNPNGKSGSSWVPSAARRCSSSAATT